MRKALLALIAVAFVAAIAWTGLWFYGKGRIVEEIEAQAEVIRARGGEASYDAVDIGGFPLGYTGRIVAPRTSMAREVTIPETGETATARYTWSAPWIEARASVTAPNTLTMTVADTQEVILEMPELGDTPLPIALTSQDLAITTTRADGEIVIDGGARTLGGTLSRRTADDGPVDVTFAIDAFDVKGRTRDDMAEGEMPPLELAYTIAGMDGTATLGGTDEQPGGTVGFGTGAAEGKGNSMGRETTGAVTLADLGVTLTFPQLGGEPLDIAIGRLGMSTRFPKEAAPQPQPFAYRVDMEKVTLPEMLWMIADPASAFEREIGSIVMDVDGTAVFDVDPSNAEAFTQAMESGMPVDLRSLRINDLTLDALGARVAASGEGALENGRPEGKGTLAVDGFRTIMNGLVKSGRIPPQQAMVVQMMVENFGKTEGEGETIRFDFEAKGGLMYVNGIPVGEAPAMPQ